MPAIQKLARIVNTGLEGEPEYAAIQIIETNKIFEFSEVKFIFENGSYNLLTAEERIQNNDLSNPIIQKILHQGHQVNLSYFEPNKDVTLYF